MKRICSGQVSRHVLVILVILTALVALPFVCFGVFTLQDVLTIWFAQRGALQRAIDHAYPGAHVVRADADAGDNPAGDTGWISVSVTFETSDAFELVKAWYSKHPEGGRNGTEGNSFPEEGLTQLTGDFDGKTRFIVPYVEGIPCARSCTHESWQIR